MKIIFSQLTENKTLTVETNGGSFNYSDRAYNINGKKTTIISWTPENGEPLIIETSVPGSWRVLRDGRKGWRFMPKEESPFVWEVLIV